jgi:hypothetical protein
VRAHWSGGGHIILERRGAYTHAHTNPHAPRHRHRRRRRPRQRPC